MSEAKKKKISRKKAKRLARTQPTVFDVVAFDTVPPYPQPGRDTGTYLLTTNAKEVGVSCLAGSKQPMAVYVGTRFVASNFALLAMRKFLAAQRPVAKKMVRTGRPRAGTPR